MLTSSMIDVNRRTDFVKSFPAVHSMAIDKQDYGRSARTEADDEKAFQILVVKLLVGYWLIRGVECGGDSASGRKLEKDYDWLGATRLYEKAVRLFPQNDFSKIAEIYERSGHAFYRSAFQAESNTKFAERMHNAILSYEKAKELHGSARYSLGVSHWRGHLCK